MQVARLRPATDNIAQPICVLGVGAATECWVEVVPGLVSAAVIQRRGPAVGMPRLVDMPIQRPGGAQLLVEVRPMRSPCGGSFIMPLAGGDLPDELAGVKLSDDPLERGRGDREAKQGQEKEGSELMGTAHRGVGGMDSSEIGSRCCACRLYPELGKV